MRTRMLAAVYAVLAACAGSEPQPTLTITPSGNQTASGPVTITAGPVELANEVTWSTTVPGTISGDKGPSVVYHPPPSTQPVTVTAAARGQTKTVTFTTQGTALPGHTVTGLTGNVDVTYDQYDIPHIFCANQNDCYAVQGYIQAQDRLFQMDLFRRIARGKLAELVGSVQLGQDKQILTLFVTRDANRIENNLVAALDASTRAKLDAFASGVNAYIAFLKQNVALMPQEYAQISAAITPNDILDWLPEDTLAVGRLQQFQLSETIEEETAYGLFGQTFSVIHPEQGRINAYIRPVQPIQGFTLAPDDSSVPHIPARPAPGMNGDLTAWLPALAEIHGRMSEMKATFGSISEGAGSNNWAVDAAHSANGQAMVANDPHLSLQYPPLFHLAALTASDSSGLNLLGGAFPGIPGALIGRSKHVAWGATVVGYDVTDLYQDTLASCGLPVPCVNGVPLAVATYSIKVRGGSDVPFQVLIVRQHGPIIAQVDSTHVISMRWTGHETTQDIKAFLDLDNADAVGDLSAAGNSAFAALKNYSVGAQNFVLADDAGNIGYDPHAIVPLRPWATTRFPWLPLPGDGTAEWGAGSGADCVTAPAVPGPCWVPDNQLPRGVNPFKGYYATANSDPAGYTGHTFSPFGSSIDSSLYSYLSFDWSDPTDVRYARIADVLRTKTTGGGKVSLDDIQKLQSDHAVLLAKLFEPLYPSTAVVNQVNYTSARGLLTQWGSDNYDCPTGLTGMDPKSAAVTDATQLRDSAACLLFHTFLQKLLHSVFDDDFAVVSAATGQSFSGDTGAEIRAILYMLQAATPSSDTHFCDDVDRTFDPSKTKAHTCQEQAITALLTAYGTLQTAYGADTTKWLWGRVHTLTTQSAAAPLIAGAFSGGPYARPGGALTVDVGNPNSSQSSPLAFAYSSGSNLRFISVMDPAAANAQVKMQLPGPERDAPAVLTNTLTLLNMYVLNQYFDFLYGHQVDNKGLSTQRFTAP